eukprot:CAMPEP_0117053662 /NCGR_PEP_ID=MMETSP0472-20121206/37128_1 /TAXON_ID=693140 ORGANISM="Tiarina fusus, Strain LIS" /NCGR_SAMPLE_ID=MMETSP0472 /ASSEMBLY_ACC=CAM_ASM_000603 /LENGTH=184 /DNA_ID=CAMNT_0004768827 /DNA_START=47 /DNA_END=598 /DNA_ORIENTATION=+
MESDHDLMERILAENATHYEVLGVEATADDTTIGRNYRQLALRFHPDVYRGENETRARQAFTRISDASEILRNEETRAEYDNYLAGHDEGGAGPPPYNNELSRAHTLRANIYFLNEMKYDLTANPNADISQYVIPVCATVIDATTEIIAFFQVYPLLAAPFFIFAFHCYMNPQARPQIDPSQAW